ncbi:MAG: DnaA family protein [Saprospiraceae bacterium]|jgi:DnaA family protein
MVMSNQQLVLPLQASGPKTVKGFITGENKTTLVAVASATKKLSLPGSFTYLYGDQSTGKTHLLLASAHQAMEQQLPAQYIDLNDLADIAKTTIKIDQPSLLCVDHIDAIAGDEEAEKKLLGLIEHVRNNGGSLIAASRLSSNHLAIKLPDLLSRLNAWPSFSLLELSEGEKQMVLRQSAKDRGFDLPREVTSWLLTHQSRDLGFLLDFLDRIDTLSLAQKRRVTIPLIKTLGT